MNRYPTFLARGGIPLEFLIYTLLYYCVFSIITRNKPLSNLFNRSENLLRIPRLLSLLTPVGSLGGMFKLNDRDILVVVIASFSLIEFLLISLFLIPSTLDYYRKTYKEYTFASLEERVRSSRYVSVYIRLSFTRGSLICPSAPRTRRRLLV